MRKNSSARSAFVAIALAVGATVALAALPIGAAAPDFTAQAALGGKTFTFSLADALKKGPVVLYFYPKAFTKGCTTEAHNFAEASEKFQALGATLIGMSNDDIETLKDFSVKECHNKFAVAADAGARIMKQYDAAMFLLPDRANRISYVISPEGKVIYAYSSLSPDNHVENTLKAVQDWRAAVATQADPRDSY
ncbi:MAG TPA: peroxiredoxin [Burkholderiaceae bacterium]|nr:peroxiredoxin [Burkholderiaceae bacterium]